MGLLKTWEVFRNFDVKAIIFVIAIIIFMTTISVTEDVKQKLLEVASELQIKLGHRVDLNEALRFLVDQREKSPQLLEEACKPIVGAKEASEELQRSENLMKPDLKGKLAVDTSALIELIYCDEPGQNLKKPLRK